MKLLGLLLVFGLVGFVFYKFFLKEKSSDGDNQNSGGGDSGGGGGGSGSILSTPDVAGEVPKDNIQ